MHSQSEPPFFLTNNTGAPQGDVHRWINPTWSISFSCDFNSLSSTRAIPHGALKLCSEARATSIVNSTSLVGVTPDNSTRNI